MMVMMIFRMMIIIMVDDDGDSHNELQVHRTMMVVLALPMRCGIMMIDNDDDDNDDDDNDDDDNDDSCLDNRSFLHSLL